jgi:putative ABC transport system permease protein
MGMNFTILGQTTTEQLGASYYAITPEYFSTMEIPLLQGRDFSANDSATAPSVVIISKSMADRWWPNQSPLGQFITLDFVPNEVPRQIVGVVGDTLQSRFQQQPNPTIYVPHVQQTTHWQGPSWNMRAAMYFVMRTAGEPTAITDDMRRAVAEIDSSRPAGLIRTVEDYLSDQLSEVRVFMMLLGIFGVSAAVLAATGIYGVMAYAVAQRTREIGIRVALGANAGNVIRLVVRQALFVIAIGMVVGIAGAYALTRFLSNFLWQVSPTDPVTFTSVSVGLVLIAVLACLVPTRRAVTVDPTVALRHE